MSDLIRASLHPDRRGPARAPQVVLTGAASRSRESSHHGAESSETRNPALRPGVAVADHWNGAERAVWLPAVACMPAASCRGAAPTLSASAGECGDRRSVFAGHGQREVDQIVALMVAPSQLGLRGGFGAEAGSGGAHEFNLGLGRGSERVACPAHTLPVDVGFDSCVQLDGGGVFTESG